MNCSRSLQNCTLCDQFCSAENGDNDYEGIIDIIYIITGLLSLAGGSLVFLTYFCIPRLKKKRSTKRAILIRTALDIVAALVGVLASIIPNIKTPTDCDCTQPADAAIGGVCEAFGVVNSFLFLTSLMWYLVLSLELYFAIKSPFSVDNKYRVLSHAIGWGYPALFTAVLIVLAVVYRPQSGASSCNPPGPGLSMFYICWISVSPAESYLPLVILGYNLPLLVAIVAAIAILAMVYRLLRTQMPASSEIRREVLKQNFLFVSFLTIDAALFLVLWLAQIIYTGKDLKESKCFTFGNTPSLVLSGLFAVLHGSKGLLDFALWWISNWIRLKDIKSMLSCCVRGYAVFVPGSDMEVNKTLRRDVMYCINMGILHVLDQRIARMNKEQQRLSKSADDTLADLVDQYVLASEYETVESRAALSQHTADHKVELTLPDVPQTIKFVDVEPETFARLRAGFHTDLHRLRSSFQLNSIKDVESSGMLEKFTEGKSGSFFYFSRDFRYIIKTVTDGELLTMRSICYDYSRHMKANPDSLLPRFFGLYRVRLASEQSYISVVVMENILFSGVGLNMDVKYDLKGSTHGRRSLKKKSSKRERYKGTLKDLDLENPVALGKDNRDRLFHQLTLDSKFLSDHSIMDYSLLLGLHSHTTGSVEGGSSRLIPKPLRDTDFTVIDAPSLVADKDGGLSPGSHAPFYVPWFRGDYGGLRSTASNHPAFGHASSSGHEASMEMVEMTAACPVPETYFMGIIDILQEYNLRKRTEHLLKTRLLCNNARAISAVPPAEYADRFVGFLNESVFVD